jgi:signal transduction histidine kinase
MYSSIAGQHTMSTQTLERAKALSAAQSRVIGMIAGGAGLPDVLDELCRTVDLLTPGVVSTVLLMDPDGKRLWPGGGPGFPDALRPAINPWGVGPDRGACGTAAFLKERVIIADVTTDPRWPDEYREMAVSHGLRASWSQPLITSTGTVLGTFAMYYAEPRVPEAADLELIEAAGQIARIAIQLEHSQAALRESGEALSMLSRRLIEAQEDERTRLARELHDDITPRLALVSMSLDRLNLSAATAGGQAEVANASRQIGDLIRDVQALSHRLHPAKLELLGLTKAAAGLCAEVSEVHGVAIDFHAENVAERLPDELSLCLFRVLQEALQNAIKHSGSRRIQVLLRSDAREIELTITDAGAGFDRGAARTRGLGLSSMAERLKLVAGELSIASKPGDGTSVRARVSLEPRRRFSSVGASAQ